MYINILFIPLLPGPVPLMNKSIDTCIGIRYFIQKCNHMYYPLLA